jgi:hypothetical protein
VLNATAEAARADLVRYLDEMALRGKRPPRIHLRPSAFNAIVRSANIKQRKSNPDGPPIAGLTYQGCPVLPWSMLGADDDAA